MAKHRLLVAPSPRRVLGAAAVAAAVGVAVIGWPSRRAVADTSFTAVASAAGVRLTVSAQNAPLTSTPVDVGGPVAQAQLDSLGTSQAFASFPYPGDLVVNLGGTVSGFTGGKVSLPAYPFYVGTSFPLAPTASTAQGPYQLTASSQPSRSAAEASAGINGGVAVTSLATSASVTHHSDGSVEATSLSTTSPFALGPLHLGTVSSESTVMLHADGTTTHESHLTISSITVGPVTIALTDKGFTILNTTVPVPSLDLLNSLLQPQHIHLAYVSARPIDHGVLSAALEITDIQNLPDVGASSVSFFLGQDMATIQGAAAPTVPAAPSSGPPAAGVITPVIAPLAPAATADTSAPAPVTTRPPSSPPVVEALPAARAVAVTGGRFSLFRFYSIFIAAALAVLGVGLLTGGKRWTT